MDAQQWGNGLSDEDFADVMSKIEPDARFDLTGESRPPEPSAPNTQNVSVPPVTTAPPTVAATEVAPTPQPPATQNADAASQTSEPTTQPPAAPSQWDSADNPYYSRAQQAETVLTRLQAAAAQAAQQQAQQEQIRQRQIAGQLIDKLPDMDPDEQRMVVQNLIGWVEDQYQGQLTQVLTQREAMSQAVGIDLLAQQYNLDDEERKALSRFRSGEEMEWYAQDRARMKQAHQAQIEQVRQQIAGASVQHQANSRLNSPIDAVVDGGASSNIRPQDADNMDDFFAALAPSLPQSWQDGR